MNFITFLKWITSTFNSHYQEEITSYLANSTDLCDLERRMAYIQSRGYL